MATVGVEELICIYDSCSYLHVYLCVTRVLGLGNVTMRYWVQESFKQLTLTTYFIAEKKNRTFIYFGVYVRVGGTLYSLSRV